MINTERLITMRKITAIIMTIALAVAVGACQSKPVTKNNAGAITLTWVMPGPGDQEDSTKVWQEFNTRLKTYPGFENVTVNFEVIPASDYQQKFLLMQTGKEKMDIINCYTLDIGKEARNGSFLPIDELISGNPDLRAELPDWVLEMGKVDGKIYAVPCYQVMTSAPYGMFVRKESSDKYMDAREVETFITGKKHLDADCYDIIEKYLEQLKANNELDLGYYGLVATKGYELFASPYAIRREDGGHPKVVNFRYSDEVKEYYRRMADWYQKGYIRKDSLSANSDEDIGKPNGITVWYNQLWRDSVKLYSEQYGFPVEGIKFDKGYYVGASTGGGNVISSTSEHPEMAMKLIDLMNTKKGADIYNLLVDGFEGEHYTSVGDNEIKLFNATGMGQASDKYGLWAWIVGNTQNRAANQYETADYMDYMFNHVNLGPDTDKSPLLGFVADVTPFEAKYKQIRAIVTEYNKSLSSGALDNWEATYNEFLDKMTKCGNQEMINDLQRQIDEFITNK
jgi:putative aldouronate transport system substrate-binding protein